MSVLFSAIFTILLPIGTCFNLKCEGKTNYVGMIYTLRVLTGLCESLCYPAMYTLFEKWVPKSENNTLSNIANSGLTLGTIIAFLFAGLWLKVKTEIIGGWTGINYIVGFVGIIWYICWVFIVSPSPEMHKSINKEERDYIINDRKSEVNTKVPKQIIKEMLTTKCCYSLYINHFAFNWFSYTLLTSLPSYMNE